MHKKLIPDTPVLITKKRRQDGLWIDEMLKTINKVGVYTGHKEKYQGHFVYQIKFKPKTLSPYQHENKFYWYYYNEFEYSSISDSMFCHCIFCYCRSKTSATFCMSRFY